MAIFTDFSDVDMRVCYFGSYQREEQRNVILMNGLISNGVDLVECHSSIRATLRRYYDLWYKFQRLEPWRFDIIFVGKIGHGDVPLAFLLGKVFRKPVVFDAFVSLYDTLVCDRKLIAANSPRARYYYFLDWLAVRLADIIILDTEAHASFFAQEFKLPLSKFCVVPIGADERVFFPIDADQNDVFDVLFFGTFIPLHGVEYIIRAAKLLEDKGVDIHFRLVGRGQTYQMARRLANELQVNNVAFLDSVALCKLPTLIASCDVGLGIFGNTHKASNVVPNKAYQIIAVRKALITGDSPAAREAFVDRRHALLCKMADPEALATAILGLKEDDRLRHKIAENGYALFKERFTSVAIGAPLKQLLEDLLG